MFAWKTNKWQIWIHNSNNLNKFIRTPKDANDISKWSWEQNLSNGNIIMHEIPTGLVLLCDHNLWYNFCLLKNNANKSIFINCTPFRVFRGVLTFSKCITCHVIICVHCMYCVLNVCVCLPVDHGPGTEHENPTEQYPDTAGEGKRNPPLWSYFDPCFYYKYFIHQIICTRSSLFLVIKYGAPILA